MLHKIDLRADTVSVLVYERPSKDRRSSRTRLKTTAQFVVMSEHTVTDTDLG